MCSETLFTNSIKIMCVSLYNKALLHLNTYLKYASPLLCHKHLINLTIYQLCLSVVLSTLF